MHAQSQASQQYCAMKKYDVMCCWSKYTTGLSLPIFYVITLHQSSTQNKNLQLKSIHFCD